MDEDGKFWFAVWVTTAVCLVALAAILSLYNMSKNTAITDMVKAGANPIDAYCAIEGSAYAGDAAMCAMRAERKS